MKKYLVFFLISVFFYSLHFWVTKHGIYGDGNGYFSLAHTVFFQPKLDFGPVYHYLGAFKGPAYTFSRIFWNIMPTKTGVLNCPWLIGPAFFWLPSFFVIHFFSVFPALYIGQFSFLYEYGCGISGIIMTLSGMFFMERTLHHDFDKRISSLVIVTLYFGSQLFYYASFEPALAHQASFFLIALILYLVRKKNTKPLFVSLLGLSMGLLVITRIGEAVLIIVPAAIYLIDISKRKSNRMQFLVILCSAAAIGVAPQLLLQRAMYGSFFYNPYFHAEKGVFHALRISSLFNQLFAAGGGFLLWSPLLIIAVAGLGMGFRKRFGWVPVVSLLIYYIVIASWEYVPPAGFGNRFFLSTLPFLSVGLAVFFRSYRRMARFIIIAAVVWNTLLIGQFFLDSNRLVKRQGLTFINLITGQITVPLAKARDLLF